MSGKEHTLYLIRHATPDFNRHDLVYYLPPGPPLTPQGEQEAIALAEYLKGAGIGCLYSSPLERCLRTAQAVSQAAGLPVAIEPGLSEAWPGESQPELRGRIWPVWEKAVKAGQKLERPAALVTHGAPIGLLLKDLGLDDATLSVYRRQFDHSNPVPPAGVWKATFLPGAEQWRLELAFMPSAEKMILNAVDSGRKTAFM
jgi:probable phosphoglycerate mutase